MVRSRALIRAFEKHTHTSAHIFFPDVIPRRVNRGTMTLPADLLLRFCPGAATSWPICFTVLTLLVLMLLICVLFLVFAHRSVFICPCVRRMRRLRSAEGCDVAHPELTAYLNVTKFRGDVKFVSRTATGTNDEFFQIRLWEERCGPRHGLVRLSLLRMRSHVHEN